MTYIRIEGGWCYLAIVLDLDAPRIVCFAVSDSPDSMLRTKALNDQHIAALERKYEDNLAYSEIETHHLGYLDAHDTFYVGKLCPYCTVKAALNNVQPSGLTADLGAPLTTCPERLT